MRPDAARLHLLQPLLRDSIGCYFLYTAYASFLRHPSTAGVAAAGTMSCFYFTMADEEHLLASRLLYFMSKKPPRSYNPLHPGNNPGGLRKVVRA